MMHKAVAAGVPEAVEEVQHLDEVSPLAVLHTRPHEYSELLIPMKT